MIISTSNSTSQFRKYSCGGILDGLVVITMGTADSQVLVGASPVEASERYEVVSVPRAINRMNTIVTESALLSKLITPPTFESLRKLFALKGITLSFKR